MNITLQTFITLLVIGSLVGGVVHLFSKSKKPAFPITLAASIVGMFAGYFVFNYVNRSALQIVFAIGGSLLIIGLVRLIRK